MAQKTKHYQVNKSLCEVDNGRQVQITSLMGDTVTCHRLRELGFCERVCIKKIADNGSVICGVDQMRVIISQALARNILVADVKEETRAVK